MFRCRMLLCTVSGYPGLSAHRLALYRVSCGLTARRRLGIGPGSLGRSLLCRSLLHGPGSRLLLLAFTSFSLPFGVGLLLFLGFASGIWWQANTMVERGAMSIFMESSLSSHLSFFDLTARGICHAIPAVLPVVGVDELLVASGEGHALCGSQGEAWYQSWRPL